MRSYKTRIYGRVEHIKVSIHTDLDSWGLPFSFDVFYLKPLTTVVSIGFLCFSVEISWPTK